MNQTKNTLDATYSLHQMSMEKVYNKWDYEMYGRDSFHNANEKFKLHAINLWEKIKNIFTVD